MAPRGRPDEQRRQAKAAAIGGLAGVVLIGVVIVLLGYPLGLIPLAGSLVILGMVYRGTFDR
ncbi:hypothetical protein GKE82_04420 [Conexibacter sp. W3-3-2]|uniref:hypothetical protein n=1 Tax=Conexibacter sp. W3-3-2 TaxID=2675227 RepID=UPI0012B6BD20|nr:hypothetical protein [Conexibacter sp. W3-3-2]MTD43566.1 hypothetical protein [Conexibacter sp. W3-3-2]